MKTTMSGAAKFATAFLLTCGAAAAQHDDARDWIGSARMTFADALAKATAAVPGAVAGAELEVEGLGDERRPAWEFLVAADDGRLHELVVDAGSGEVLEDEVESGASAGRRQRAARTLRRHAGATVAELAEQALKVVHGAVVAASVDLDDGPCVELRIANGRYLIEVVVEARAGHVVELELVDDFEDAQEEDERDEGEEREGEEREDADEDEEKDEHEGDEAGREAEPGAERRGAAVIGLPRPTPLADRTRFVDRIDHPFLPLSTVSLAELRSAHERVVREVMPEPRSVAGVLCTVLAEKEYEDGELAEISYNCFAQDEAGNVWYFGEDVDDYAEGKVVGHGGAWMVGRNAKEPCLFMPAQLEVGRRFKREDSPPAAEEFDEVEGRVERLAVPSGEFSDVLVIAESDRAFGEVEERKYYARGVGLISENRELNLVSFRRSDR